MSRLDWSPRTIDWKLKKFPNNNGPCRRNTTLEPTASSTRSISKSFSCIEPYLITQRCTEMLIFGYRESAQGATSTNRTVAADYNRGVFSGAGAVLAGAELWVKSISSLPCAAPARGPCWVEANGF